MEVMEAIRTRRSIRKYRSDPVPQEDIECLLEAARLAPSWANSQCWHFVVVTDPQVKEAMAEAGNPWAAPTNSSRNRESTVTSLFSSSMYSVSLDSASCIARLQPPANPRFLGLVMSRMESPNRSWRTWASSPEEPLSITMVSQLGYVITCSDSRHSLVSARPFQLRTTTATLGERFIAVGDMPPVRRHNGIKPQPSAVRKRSEFRRKR